MICYSLFAQHCQEVIPREWLDPPVYPVEISVSEVFLVVEEYAHLPDEAFKGDCPFLLAAIEGGEDVAEKRQGKT